MASSSSSSVPKAAQAPSVPEASQRELKHQAPSSSNSPSFSFGTSSASAAGGVSARGGEAPSFTFGSARAAPNSSQEEEEDIASIEKQIRAAEQQEKKEKTRYKKTLIRKLQATNARTAEWKKRNEDEIGRVNKKRKLH